MKRLITYTAIVMIVSALCFAVQAQEKTVNPPQKPASEIAADSNDYIIGPEDVLNIHVWKEESMSKTVPVRIDGKISLPLADDIQAAGLTPLQLKNVIIDKLKGFIESPAVTVTVMEANSYKIFISGEVKNPGVFSIRRETTLLKAIITAGGFTEWANKRKILVISGENGKEQRTYVNYNKIVDGDIPDVVIKRGDTIIVR
ncbi:MAG: polysaccharide biosynthesis/export family protein [Smithellaceae bacterium]|nr:polysaccharide biosynthesis/export family protein [Smithellaceae bacterium]